MLILSARGKSCHLTGRVQRRKNNIALLFDGDSRLIQAQFVMCLKPVCELEAYCICSERSGEAEPNYS